MTDTTSSPRAAADGTSTIAPWIEVALYGVLLGTFFSPLLRDGAAIALVVLLIAKGGFNLPFEWRAALALFAVANVGAAVANEGWTESMRALRFYPIGGAIFVGAFEVVRCRGSRRVSRFVFVLLVVFALDTLWQMARGESLIRGQLPVDGRFMGSLVHPTNMSLLPILLPFGLASVGKEPTSLRWLYGIGSLAVALAVAASGTRAAWLGLFALLVSAGATRGRRFTWMLLGSFLLVSLTVALWLPSSSPRRLLLLGPTGEAQRLVQWKAAWTLFAERPLLGHGPQSFRRLCIARHDQTGSIFAEIDLDQAPYPHDLYLEALVGTGVVGLAALLLPVGLAFQDLRRLWRAGLPERGIAATLAVFLVIGVVDLSFVKDWIHLTFWLPIGAAAGLASARDAQIISGDAENA